MKLNDTFQCHKFDKKIYQTFVLEELKNDSEKDNKLHNDYLIDTQSVHTIVTLTREILIILNYKKN